MKSFSVVLLTLLCICLSMVNVYSQNNVAINTTGDPPDASALLDIQSNNKGLLVPRMSTADRNAISSPATGLIVYDLDFSSFFFYAGSEWIEVLGGFTSLLADSDQDTKIQVEESADEDVIRFDIAGTEMGKMDGRTFHLSAPGSSLFIGLGSGTFDDGTNNYSTGVGINALNRNTTGFDNTAFGYSANRFNQTGSQNTIIGSKAGQGTLLHNKSGNVFLGYSAGYYETGDNKLYIENSSSSAPLIYGDFTDSAEIVAINGYLGVGTQSPAHPFHVRKDGVDSVQTIVGILQSVTSARPVLLFSENTSNDFASGMSIEYNGAAGFGSDNEMYINLVGGESMVTFENSGNVGIGTTEPLTKLHIEGGTDSAPGGGGFITLGAIDGANLTFDNNEIMARNNGSVANMLMQYNGGKLGIGQVTFDSKVNIRSDVGENPLRARVSTATKFLVHSNGGVAIGANATPPVNGLKVYGDILMEGDDITSNQTLRLNSATRIEIVVGPNTIVVDPVTGITITADDDITFDAGNDIILNAGHNIDLDADNDILIDAIESISSVAGYNYQVEGGNDVNIISANDIDMDANLEIQLNANAPVSIESVGEVIVNGTYITMDGSASVSVTASTLDLDGSTLIDMDSGGTVFIDGGEVYLATAGNTVAGAAHIGSNVLNPACEFGCNGTVNSGSSKVKIGY